MALKHATTLAFVASFTLLAGPLPASADTAPPGPNEVTTSEAKELVEDAEPAPGNEYNVAVVTENPKTGAPEYETITVKGEKAAVKTLVNESKDEDVLAAAIDEENVMPMASNDTYRSQQWALNTFRAEESWKSATGKGVTVAVIDSGVFPHADLGNSKTTPRVNTASVVGGTGRDFMGHGTSVSSVIAARANNRRGMAGQAPNANILSIRVFQGRGGASGQAISKGIVLAANRGARVINLSLGGTGVGLRNLLQPAIDYANRRNIIVVAATGNGGPNGATQYPGSNPGVVGVGSVDRSLRLSNFSTRRGVDVVAPGGNIVVASGHGNYVYSNGTSFATPYVSAVFAQMIQQKRYKYNRTDLINKLKRSSQDLGSRGFDSSYGFGIVRPLSALKAVGATVAPPAVPTFTSRANTSSVKSRKVTFKAYSGTTSIYQTQWSPTRGATVASTTRLPSNARHHYIHLAPGEIRCYRVISYNSRGSSTSKGMCDRRYNASTQTLAPNEPAVVVKALAKDMNRVYVRLLDSTNVKAFAGQRELTITKLPNAAIDDYGLYQINTRSQAGPVTMVNLGEAPIEVRNVEGLLG